jgi:hypothetical protein
MSLFAGIVDRVTDELNLLLPVVMKSSSLKCKLS